MVVEEQIKKLKPGQELWYKNLYTLPEKVIVKSIDYLYGELVINLEDYSYISKKEYNSVFLTKKECEKACEVELIEKLNKLRAMMEK